MRSLLKPHLGYNRNRHIFSTNTIFLVAILALGAWLVFTLRGRGVFSSSSSSSSSREEVATIFVPTRVDRENLMPQATPSELEEKFSQADAVHTSRGNLESPSLTPNLDAIQLLRTVVPKFNCMIDLFEKTPLPEGFHSRVFNLPGGIDAVFVIHYTPLTERHELQTKYFRKFFNDSVIWITEFDREALTLRDYQCAVSKVPREPRRSVWDNGEQIPWTTVSVSYKHFYAYYLQLKYNIRVALYLEDDAKFVSDADFASPSSRWNGMMRELPSNFDFVMMGFCTGVRLVPTEFKHLALSQESRCADAYLSSRKGCYNAFRTLPIHAPHDHQMNEVGFRERNLVWKMFDNSTVFDDVHIYYMEPFYATQAFASSKVGTLT